MEDTFRIGESAISARSFDKILRDLSIYLKNREGDQGKVVLDLRDVDFIDPYGIGMLCLMGRYLNEGGFGEVIYRLPDAGVVKSYLGRMKFLKALEECVSFEGREWSLEYAEGVVNEALLEVTRIKRREDIESALQLIDLRVDSILTEELGYAIEEITRFKNVVAELCHNILDHSLNWGYVVAQRYRDHRREKKFAIIGVGDLGIGIKKSLSFRFDVSGWTHTLAITNALRKDFSRDPTRGIGLYVVNKVCRDYNGSLHIRSGDTRVYVRGMNVYSTVSAPFPGTQVSIALYQKD